MTPAIAEQVARIAAPTVEDWVIERVDSNTGAFLSIYGIFRDGKCKGFHYTPRNWDDAVQIGDVIAVARECQNILLAWMEGQS